ncbi:MAG TPA: GC-type dockerin domain-anchored protein [Phycisphaerales bacterium]|nr:GC-type dockerin domain-anchored protein [Phycisphaerales bacterium]
MRGSGWFMGAGTAIALVTGSAQGQNVACLSDEFEDGATITAWRRVHVAESWNADQLEIYDINASLPGGMVMMPYACTWYRDYRGPMNFKLASGDFALTAHVRVTSRDGVSTPGSLYSLGGIMLRTPRAITPGTWTPGGENYVFLSLGYGQDTTIHPQFEVKTTIASDSVLQLSPAQGLEATLQIARAGEYVIALLREPGGPWEVHRRYHRPDMPGILQAGMVTYSDWLKASTVDPFVHNQTVFQAGMPSDPSPWQEIAPDLIAGFEYARFAQVELPPALIGVDLTDPVLVPDGVLLSFLGASLDVPGPEQVRITGDPPHAAVHIGDTAVFSIETTGTVTSYAWRMNGVPLSDGSLPSGAEVSGSSTSTLTIDHVSFMEDGAELSCRVQGACTDVESVAGVLTVLCPSDHDGSGFVDTDDFDSFVAAFEAGTDDADFDGTGFVDTDDFDAFIRAFESGC